jgi:hypothetical protein
MQEGTTLPGEFRNPILHEGRTDATGRVLAMAKVPTAQLTTRRRIVRHRPSRRRQFVKRQSVDCQDDKVTVSCIGDDWKLHETAGLS